MGVKVSQVNFHCKIEDLADWASSKAIRAAYEDFADQSQADIQSDTTLILTNDGWVHQQLFQR